MNFFPRTLCMTLLLVAIPLTAVAVSRSGEDVVVEAGEVITDDLYVASDLIRIVGIVDGDLFAAGGKVKIEGTVKGDVYVAGGTVEIFGGTVEQDVVVAGGTVRFSRATIGDGILLAAGNASIDKATTVGGSVLFGAGTFDMYGSVQRNLYGGAGLITIGGSVQQDTSLGVQKITVADTARLGGNLIYYAPQPGSINPSAEIKGTVTHIPPTKTAGEKNFFSAFFRTLLNNIEPFFAALLIGFVLIATARKESFAIAHELQKAPLWSFTIGVIAFVTLPFVFFMLLLSFIGIPLAFILIVFFMIALYTAKIFIALLIGTAVFFKKKHHVNPYGLFALGLLVFFVTTSLPIIGRFLWLVGSIAAFGGMLIMKYKKIKTTA